MVEPIAKKSVWIFITLFPVFISITQFSDFWVMSYGNWKHICNYTHMHGPTVSATHVSAAFDASSTALFSTNIFIFLYAFFGLCCTILSFIFFVFLFFVFHFLWSMLHCSFFLLFFFFFFFTFSCLHCTVLFFPSFLPFSSQTHKKKKSMIGATNWLLWVCEFSGCFKLRTEVVVVVGIGGWRKKKRNAWVEVSGFGRKWCEGGKPTRMPDMLLRYGFHKK